jgi:hypothetical protein
MKVLEVAMGWNMAGWVREKRNIYGILMGKPL